MSNETNAVAVRTSDGVANRPDILRILKTGDIGRLNDEQQLAYYLHECNRMGLDPAARPLEFMNLSGRTVLYAKRVAGDMLAAKHGVTVAIVEGPEVRKFGSVEVIYVKARATMPSGRYVDDIGTKPATDIVLNLMKCVTVAERRATLRLCGWGGPDESELESLSGARPVPIRALDHDDAPALEAEADSLARLRDDLASYGPDITADQAARCFLDMRDEGADPSDLAEGFELAKFAARLSAAALKRAIDRASTPRPVSAAEAAAMDPMLAEGETPASAPVEAPAVDPPRPPAEPAALTDFRARCHECADLAALARAWRDCRTQLLEASKETGKAGWWVAVACVQTVTASKSKAAAEKALKAAVEALEPRPTPPTGTDAPANDAPAATTGDAREATPAQGAQASAEWEAHLATKPNPFAVHASLAKRAAEFRAAGVLDARTRTAMLRVQALIGTTSEMVALAVLREPSRHYAGKAA